MNSLQNWCLTSIAKNLDYFRLAYLSKEAAELKLYLLLLQKRYTDELLRIFRSNVSLTLDRKYFDLLITEHLKDLSTDMFHANDLEQAMEYVIKIAPVLQNITFQFPEVETYSFHPKTFMHAVIPHLENIEVLVLNNQKRFPFDVTDDTLKLISCHCPTLKELILRYCYAITNEGIANLCRSDGSQGLTLKSIKLIDNLNLDEGVYHLFRNMPSLEKIEYFNFPILLTPLHQKDLFNNTLHLLPKYNLTSLECDHQVGVREFNISLRILAEMCPHLTKLRVSVSDENVISAIEKFTNLTNLDIVAESLFFYFYPPQDFWDVNSLLMNVGKKLKYLKLGFCEFSLSVLISCCPELEELHLLSSRIQPPIDEGKDLYFNKLKILEFSSNDFFPLSSDIILSCDKILKSCSVLEKLKLSDIRPINMFRDILQKFCEQTETLEELDMELGIRESNIKPSMLPYVPLRKLKVKFFPNIEKNYFSELEAILNENKTYLG